ncbi:MAG: DUF1109 family protein [Polyangiaceae bacterium]|nr:DUF1109 family protein [Polyangiaceae bacterium]
MTAPPPQFADIPDPAAEIGERVLPNIPMPTNAAPTRRQVAAQRVLAALLGVGWAVAVVGWVGLRPDLLNAQVLVQLGVWTVAMPLGLALAVRPKKTGFPASVAVVRLGLAALPTMFVALAFLPIHGTEVPLSIASLSWCVPMVLVAGVPSVLGATFVLRHALLNAPGLRGALIGAACGLAGAISIHAHCPIVTASHVVVGHGLPVVVFAVVGAIFGAVWGRV